MAYPSAPPFHHKFVTVRLADISTASSELFVPGFRGKVRKISAVLAGALSGADADLTFEVDGTEIAGSGITVAEDESAAGDVYSVVIPVLTATAAFNADSVISVETDGASTGAHPVTVTLELEPV